MACPQYPDQALTSMPPYWTCDDCELIHFRCARCDHFKTIPFEWMPQALNHLVMRARALNMNRFLCDLCYWSLQGELMWHPQVIG